MDDALSTIRVEDVQPKIATIGLKSTPPKLGNKRRKMRRNGSQMSRRKPSTASVVRE